MDQDNSPIVGLIRTIVSNLVDKPEDIIIKTEIGDRATVISIYTDKGDIGKVIGRGGKIIAAIRSICQSIASKENKRVDVHVIE